MVGFKKFVGLSLVILLVSTLLVGCGNTANTLGTNKNEVIKIGITQIAEHPALDLAREGFIEGLKSKGYEEGKNIEIDYQNAQGDMSVAQTIGNNFATQKKDLILAIATNTAQAAYNATKDIPILITAVTDPVKAGLVKSFDKPDTNVTGTSDAVPIDNQFKLLKTLVPDAKKIGILYNTSEVNSEIQVNAAKEISAQFGFEIITSGITNINDISQSLDSLLDKVDVIYIPTDNVVASSMPLIYSRAMERNIPIIGAEGAHVESGALATEGIDYYKLGLQTGIMAVEVIEGKNPKDMEVTTLKDTELVINMDTAKKLNIEIPKELIERAKIIESGEK